MAAQRFVDALNAQIGSEFSAQNQYIGVAAYYDGLTMPRLAGLFYRQAAEERAHGMMMVRYLLDRDEPVRIPAVAEPAHGFADVIAPIQLAVEQERQVTEQIDQLVRIAREEHDYASEQFMHWFVKEQVEEVATMTDLLAVVTRSANDLERIEDFVAREGTRRASDPTAPAQAGADA